MDQPSKLSLAAKYVAEDRLLLASVFAAILVAVTLIWAGYRIASGARRRLPAAEPVSPS